MPDTTPLRLIVLGASAGGIEALGAVVGALPEDLDACVLIVQHLSPTSHGHLAGWLERTGELPVQFARDGDAYAPGHIFVAPPDQHLFAGTDRMHVTHGPRVNRSRPAIDLLMRSAAANHGHRVVGAILSGLMDDGAAGLFAIQQCGGLAYVQAPHDAAFPDMPNAALAVLTPTGVHPASELGRILAAAAHEAPPTQVPIPETIRKEVLLERRATGDIAMSDELGTRIPASCPDCSGPLWELDVPGPKRYRCHIGHSYTRQTFLTQQRDNIEQSLWVAMRTLEERARMLDGLNRRPDDAYATRATEARTHADNIRGLLEEIGGVGDGQTLPATVAPTPSALPAT